MTTGGLRKEEKSHILNEAQPSKTISTSIHFSVAMLYPDLLEARNQHPTTIQDRGNDMVNIRRIA